MEKWNEMKKEELFKLFSKDYNFNVHQNSKHIYEET